MTKLEQVIYGLDCCSWGIKCSFCPYKDEPECRTVLMCDALKLLKDQKKGIAPKPTDEKTAQIARRVGLFCPNYWCGNCEYHLIKHSKFCPNCGKKVKWDD